MSVYLNVWPRKTLSFCSLLKKNCFVFFPNISTCIFFFSPQAMWLCKHFNAIRVSQETLLFKEALRQTEEAKAYKERNQVCKRI